ncbi:RlpA-like protein [Methylacidimicrobium tartarophylax]|uniref:Probable endolytic peptidoglycan transglycosylase RlpA n=2 Tax=Methylacidimicrobium tartarophylax TaxID=1041768 RepID=A0A5E6M9X1_9BACT|nr:RlpA-like protein [Methylacidimicrobium tartarophylax]
MAMFANPTSRAAVSRYGIGGFRFVSVALLLGSLVTHAKAKAPKTRPSPAVPTFRAKGIASWYDESRFTSTGERYRAREMTAAHPSLPFNTLVSVRNIKNGRIALVRINDRGPYKKGRIIDLSRAAAGRIGMLSDGVAPVELRIVPPSRKAFSFLHSPARGAANHGPVPF